MIVYKKNISVRYRTMRELQELPESDPNLQSAKKQISSYKPVIKMIALYKGFSIHCEKISAHFE